MRTLYFDLFAGCSGDMILGALVDLGADFNAIRTQLSSLRLEGYSIEKRQVIKNGITATRILVRIQQPSENHSSHHHHHGTDPGQPEQDTHHHPHRSFRDIRQLLHESTLPKSVTTRAVAIFEELARAEGKIHGKSPEDVCFHEVGAVDSIVDIVGISLAVEQLDLDDFACSAVNIGSGTVTCAHGVLPVPAPATAELLQGFPAYSAHFTGELTTPTGASVLKTLVPKPGVMPAGVIRGIGYGAGSRDLEKGPNVLRLLLLEDTPRDGETGDVIVMECNLDDMNPEVLGSLAEELLSAGALDVFLTPVQMKKFRPGTLLTILCRPDRSGRMSDMLLSHSSTFGIRWSAWQREELERRHVSIETRFGAVDVKAGLRAGRLLKVSPEYEECRKLAGENALSIGEIYREVERSIAENWDAVSEICTEDGSK